MAGMIHFPRSLSLQFLIVGVGANGSHFFRGLCQDLRTHLNAYKGNSYNCPFYLDHIMLVDGDLVEKKNLGNQLFEEDEVGEYKVCALAERYGEHYNLEVLRRTEYIRDVSEISRLMIKRTSNTRIALPVIVGMLDNNATRQLLDTYFRSEEVENLLYLDAGVHGVSLDRWEKPRPDTGNSGQVCVGLKFNGNIVLEPVGGLYPEVLTDVESQMPGCGVLIQSAPQRGSTNKFAAQIANNVINTLLTERAIMVHQVTFDSRMCGSRPVYVSNAQVEAMKQAETTDQVVVSA
jgi:hypothetical protein